MNVLFPAVNVVRDANEEVERYIYLAYLFPERMRWNPYSLHPLSTFDPVEECIPYVRGPSRSLQTKTWKTSLFSPMPG